MFDSKAGLQWTRQFSEKDCYICNRSNKVSIFYRRYYADSDFEEISNPLTEKALRKFYKLDSYKLKNKLDPILLGSLTDWAPIKMMPALYFSIMLMGK